MGASNDRRAWTPWGRARKSAEADRPVTVAEPPVPPGMIIAGAWAWRLLAIAAVLAGVIALIVYLRLLVIPVLLATVLAALLVPFKNFLVRHRWPRWTAILTAELGLLVVVSALIYLVVTQVSSGIADLKEESAHALQGLTAFLADSPLGLTIDVETIVGQLITVVQDNSAALLSGVASFGSSLGHLLAGTLLTLFATLFMLIDGDRIWAWLVRLFPRRARPATDSAGKAGWQTLQAFVKVQILVATIDAVGIGIGAAILGVPLAIPIAVLVFLGSFIPIIGAILTGAVAVFIALVYNGWVVALIMLGIVLLVQQVESHVLQPLIMGTAVKVHPLAVVLAVAGGSMVAGIAGAFFAVPVVATLNTMITHIASRSSDTLEYRPRRLYRS